MSDWGAMNYLCGERQLKIGETQQGKVGCFRSVTQGSYVDVNPLATLSRITKRDGSHTQEV